jgi:hypothetical protein
MEAIQDRSFKLTIPMEERIDRITDCPICKEQAGCCAHFLGWLSKDLKTLITTAGEKKQFIYIPDTGTRVVRTPVSIRVYEEDV